MADVRVPLLNVHGVRDDVVDILRPLPGGAASPALTRRVSASFCDATRYPGSLSEPVFAPEDVMSKHKEKTAVATESTKALAVDATTATPATEGDATKKPESLVDEVFDTVTAWAAKGLGAAKRGLEASARWLDARAKVVGELATKLQA
jgi:hypothetical protein